MKALVLEEYGKLVYKDVPDPEIKNRDDLKIKVKAVGVCGSDIHGVDGSTGRRKPPVIMGHDFSGVAEKTGSGADVVFDVVGIQKVSADGLYLLKKGGQPVLTGLKDQGINISWLTEHFVPLSEGASWFKRIRDKEPGLYKIIFNPEK